MDYLRILGPKGAQTFERMISKKKVKDSMKVERGVHRKKYDGHCTKQ